MRWDRPAQGRSLLKDPHGLILHLTACEQPEKQCEPENTMAGCLLCACWWLRTIRLSWLRCEHGNANHFKPRRGTVAGGFEHSVCDSSGDARVTGTAIGPGSPPRMRCDGATLDPTSPHRVYLIGFPYRQLMRDTNPRGSRHVR